MISYCISLGQVPISCSSASTLPSLLSPPVCPVYLSSPPLSALPLSSRSAPPSHALPLICITRPRPLALPVSTFTLAEPRRLLGPAWGGWAGTTWEVGRLGAEFGSACGILAVVSPFRLGIWE